MKLRLIKQASLSGDEEAKPPPDRAPIVDIIRSWVREFQSTRAGNARQDFERLTKSHKE